ncbi:hypothetical protein STEG23_015019, partial [Scotinomys teguina]
EEVFHPRAAKDSLLATLRRPMLSQQLGTLRTVPQVTWTDYIREPGRSMKACSLPMWSPCLDTREVNSSVSSGRMSDSSGGHESCALFHGPWKERPPLVLGPQRQPRKSNTRLEQLKEKIRAQARRQASCASLGTSVSSSASYLYKNLTVPQRKNPKVTNALPVPACPGSAERRSKDRVPLSLRQELSRTPRHHTSVPRTNIKRIRSGSYKRETPKSSVPRRTAKGRDSELTGVYAWRKGQALVRRLLGPPPALARLQSKAPATELGSDKKVGAVGDLPAHTWLPKPTRTHRGQQVSEHTPSLAIHDQSATIQGAMEILQDLRQQIQAGLELARRPRAARKLSSKPQNPAGKRQQGPQSTWDMQGSSKSAWTETEGTCSSLDRAGNVHGQQYWKKAVAERESCPQRAWTTLGQDTSFQGPGSTPEKLNSFSQRPWSALAWQTCPQRAWEARGQDTSFQRSGCPTKKPSLSQRPWSALAGQACSQRTYTACKDWEVPGSSPWSSMARPHPALQQPWSNPSVQRSSLYSKDENVPRPSEVKLAWPETAQDFPQSKPAKEWNTQESPPCPRPQRSLGQSHSSESLRDFMRQKAQARRQQAMEQKALAAHTLELRNQRLQEVYRKQREAILGKAVPVVSQRSPSIVTFVPSSVQSGGLEAPGSLRSPLRKWSKVTSGMVLGDQEAPDSFCLCLNKPWNHAETQDTGCPQKGYKQARLQALETMANVLKQRIDILTTKLHKSMLPETAGDLAWDMRPLDPSAAPTTSALTPPPYLRSLVSDDNRGTPQDGVDMQAKPLLPDTYFQDGPTQGLLSLSDLEPVQQDPAPSQLALPKFCLSDRPTYKWSVGRPEPGTERSRTFHRFTIAMLEQSLRDEELRAQHQAAVLRLRELVLEEKAFAELTCLEHQIGCLEIVGCEASQTTLREKQQRALSRLEKERREIQYLKKACLSLHHDRKQLLQHQQSILNVQRSVAHLRQELQARTRLLQSSSPNIKATWEGASDTSQKTEGRRPRSPQSHQPWDISESSEVANLSSEQKEVTPPQTTSAADKHLKPPRLKWADVTPGTGSPPVESGYDNQGPGKQPRVSPPGLLHASSLDPEHQKHPAFPIIKRDVSPASELKPQEAKELPPPGDLQTKPSAAWAVERQPADSHAWSLHGQCGQSPGGDGPCLEEARMAENRTNQGLGVSRSPKGEYQEEAHWQSEQQRCGAWIPSTSDSTLPLSFHLDTGTSGRVGLILKANVPTEASAGYQEEPQNADTSLSVQRKPLQALPDPKAPMTLKTPEDRAPLVTEVASPSYVDGFLAEILSPVDEQLSYGSGELPSSIHRDTHLPPPPPSPQAKSDINEPNPSSEDFPSPPEEAMFSGDSLDTLGEDMSITIEDTPSLSEEALEEALSLGPQKSGHCLGASGHDGSLDDASLTSPLSNRVVSAPEMSPRLSAQPLSPSPVACVARKHLEEASGSQGGPWEAVQCFESTEHQLGIEHLLDRRTATSSPSWSAPSENPPLGPVPSVASGQAESLKHTSEKEKEGQSCRTEGQPKLQDLLDRQQLCRRDSVFDPASGACADFPGTGDAGPVDVVSTQLSKRILCDSLAALSGLASGDSP